MTDGTVVDVAGVLAGIRDVAETRIAPGAAEVDRSRSFPDSDIEALAGVGALGLLVPVEHGGAGGSLKALAEACEIVGAASASTGMVFLMHAVATATVAGGGGERAGELLTRMATGEALGTLAFSERGNGAHFYNPELAAEQHNGSVRVSGRRA